MPSYDIVVVGAGCAGLSAALQCALSGKRTLLIEQHNLPGGAATSFVRGRFEIEPSLHELCDFGPAEDPGDIRQMLEAYGVEIEWVRVQDCFRCVSRYSDGGLMDVTMPSGVDPFIDALESYVPGCRNAAVRLFALFEEVRDGIACITEAKGSPDPAVLKAKYPNMLRTGAYPVKKVFDALKLPRRAQDILSVYWSYLGVDTEHLAFIHYAAMVYKYISRGAYIPRHTSHNLSNAMVERFRELGGEVWFNCRAEEFLFQDGRISGVRTSMGTVDCRYVLANINPDIIYGSMMPRELVPQREKKLSAARKGRYGARMFTAYLCLDAPPEALNIHDYSIFLPGTADSAAEYKSIMKGMDSNDYSIFLCCNIADPDFSPPGTCVCSFTTFAAPEDWNELDPRDYFLFKNRIVKKLLQNLKDRLHIDLAGHIEETAVATPWTFARYLGTPEGAVYGYETAGWDGMMARMQMLDRDYPIPGLRPIGAAGPRGDGYSAALICGRLMADAALKELTEKGGEL